jgi:glycosyltransferase involved in cell wall biosynthesis
MKVLLTSNASHDPPKGGSTRSNLAWLRHMAANGHECTAVAPGEADRTSVDMSVRIESYRDLSLRTAVLSARISELRPDWVLVSSEDLSHVLLREAARAAASRLVYLAHTPQFMPFGPEAWHADPAAAAIVGRAAGVVTIGHHMADYVKRHLGREAAVIHPPIYGSPPWPNLGRFDAPLVLMINPCTVKGLPILLGLAEIRPRVRFAALNGWGTSKADRAAIERTPNVQLLAGVPHIEDVLSQTRVLMMPSLWYEGFGLITMEAMLRGVPVIASDSGGLAEAMQGSSYIVPVRPVERYGSVVDDTGMPRAFAPEPDLEPWAEALDTLTFSRHEWLSESVRSKTAAEAFVSKLDAADFERWLCALTPEPPSMQSRLQALDPAQRARVAALLKARKSQ